jgi:hypothetical protein
MISLDASKIQGWKPMLLYAAASSRGYAEEGKAGWASSLGGGCIS